MYSRKRRGPPRISVEPARAVATSWLFSPSEVAAFSRPAPAWHGTGPAWHWPGAGTGPALALARHWHWPGAAFSQQCGTGPTLASPGTAELSWPTLPAPTCGPPYPPLCRGARRFGAAAVWADRAGGAAQSSAAARTSQVSSRVQMWQGLSPVRVQMYEGVSPVLV